MNFIQKYKLWREKQYWSRRQLEYLRQAIITDWLWLANDPVANELTERYRQMLREDWYTLQHEDSAKFRKRIGLDPVYTSVTKDNNVEIRNLFKQDETNT